MHPCHAAKVAILALVSNWPDFNVGEIEHLRKIAEVATEHADRLEAEGAQRVENFKPVKARLQRQRAKEQAVSLAVAKAKIKPAHNNGDVLGYIEGKCCGSGLHPVKWMNGQASLCCRACGAFIRNVSKNEQVNLRG